MMCKYSFKIKHQSTWGMTFNTDYMKATVWVSWKVRTVVQVILLQSRWQRNQWDFSTSSCITSVEVSDKNNLFHYIFLIFSIGIITLFIKVNSPVTSAVVWVHCCIAGADVWLSCCGICTQCFDFFWMLAFEMGRAVEQMSPDVQKNKGLSTDSY